MHSQRDKDPKSRSRATAQHDHSHEHAPRRSGNAVGTDELMCVRLTRKYADLIDGVDLSDAHVGDRLDLSRHDAEVLIAEGWAERAVHRAGRRRAPEVRAIAADKPRPRPPRRKKST